MKKYIELLRLDKPIGFMLLFWPCAFGFGYSLSVKPLDSKWIVYLILFLIGSILMRGAGCIYNDIVDRKIDKKVARTKKRPIASGKISVRTGWYIIFALIFFSLIILIQFNLKSIIFGIFSGFIILIYPFAKRFTFWPQLFLGIVFNWGVLLAWFASDLSLNLNILLLYLSCIFWTLGYDTIYALQDLYDDLKLGIKSTAIKFRKSLKEFLIFVYGLSFVFIFYAHWNLPINNKNMLILLLFPLILLIYQIVRAETKKNSRINLSLFKLNNYYGLTIFLTQLIIFNA